MIITELLNDGTLIKRYSDSGFLLLQLETGEKYVEPIDVYPCHYTYIETQEREAEEQIEEEIHEELDEENVI